MSWTLYTAWCQNPECGQEFSPTESASGNYCSHECEERAIELEDEAWDECPCEGVSADEDPVEAHDPTCPVRVELEK